MKLRRLEIEHYGIFSDAVFEFGDGFQLILGPNEAGKSTLLQAIRETLFGFPTRTPYDFSDHAGKMAATAVIELADGGRVRYRRRKGRKDTVVGQFEADGKSVNAQQLGNLLGDASLELYRHVFGFSLAELSSGEESLKQANLNEALYGGALGGLSNYQQIQSQLQEEAGKLFTPAARTREIPTILKKIKDAGSQLRNSSVKPREYEKQVAERDQLGEQVASLRQQLADSRLREARLRRVEDALPCWLRLRNAREQLDQLDVPAGFPADGAQELARRKERRDELAQQLEEARDELEEKRSDLQRLRLAPALVDTEPTIRARFQQVGEIQGFRSSLPKVRGELKQLESKVQTTLRELNPDWDLADLERFRTSLQQRERVERFGEQRETLDRQRTELATRQESLRDEVAKLRSRLEGFRAVDVPERLESLVDDEPAYREQVGERNRVATELGSLRIEMEGQAARLDGHLQCRLDYEQRLPVPPDSRVEEFRARDAQLRERTHHARKALEDAREEVLRRQEDLRKLDALEQVPDQQQLQSQRRRRDEGWSVIRAKFIERTAVPDERLAEWETGGDSGLADQYEQAVQHADQLADERQAKSKAAAQRDQLTLQLEQLARRVEQREDQLQQALGEDQQLETQWQALWSACGFRPLPPDAMKEWLRQYEQLDKWRQQQRKLEARQEALERPVAEYETRLRQAMNEPGDDLDVLLTKARQTVNAARNEAIRRNAWAEDLAGKQQQLEQVERQLEAWRQRDEDWQTGWKDVLREFDFPSNWTVQAATRILNGLSNARTAYNPSASLQERIADMEEGIQQFERAVDELRTGLAPEVAELAELPAEAAVDQLSRRLDQAKSAQGSHENLTRQIQQLVQRGERFEERLGLAARQIAQLLEQAGVDGEEEFLRIAEDARRHAELTQQIRTAAHEISVHRGTEDEAEFEQKLNDADADSVAHQRRELLEVIERLEGEYEKVNKEFILQQQQLDTMQAASEAAGVAMDLESARSSLASAVDRWVPLVLAQTLMKRAIERFEREHQPAMLSDVKRLFQELTMNRYVDIERKLDEHGTLLVVEAGGRKKEPSMLSTGTREQLYLAIRLAYIMHYCQDAEPLPIVMDDVLVNFDRERATQTLRVLREVAERVQILFLTCHQHMIELVETVHPGHEPLRLELAPTG